MPPSSDGDEDLQGSAGEVKNQTGAAPEASENAQGVDSANSPTAEPKDDKKPTDMVSAVRAALDGGKEQSSGSGEGEGDVAKTPTDPAKAKAKEGEEGGDGELTDEEFNSLKPKTQARIKKLLKQTEAQAQEIAAYKPQAETLQRIQQYTSEAGLEPQEVNTGFRIMALMKNDPVKAYEALAPIFNTLEALVGVKLPTDLQQQVTDGEITQERAQELSRLRAAQGLSHVQQENSAKRTEAANKARAETEAVQKLTTEVGTATTQWEERQKTSDPDFSLKQSRVMEAIELELLKQLSLAEKGQPNTLPTNAQEAVAFCDKIKSKVDGEMKKFIRKTPITPVIGNGLTNDSKPAPKTIYDAVAQAVGHR